MTTQPEKMPDPDQRLREAYAALERTALEPDVKIAVKAILTIRQAVNWATVDPEERKGKVDATIVKYIRASSAQSLPALMDEVLKKLPYEKIFRQPLGEFALDIYPQLTTDEEARRLRESALQRVKQEPIPLFLISKKFYQDTQEVTS